MKDSKPKKKPTRAPVLPPAGFTCRVCGIRKPREAYPAKGRRGYICQACAKVSLPKRIRLQQEEEIFHFLRQACISPANQARLETLTALRSSAVASKASLVLEVARSYPFKKNRLRDMSRENPALLQKLREVGLVMSY
ncbi:MAG: hypothetical protein IH892_00660 [Planctomycetes bacterium]|nr:hypothetical protein [Planctomycetota bacterium]